MPSTLSNGLRVEALPELAKFVQIAESRIVPGDWESFWACEQSFVQLVQSSFVARLMVLQLEKMAENSGYLPIAVTESEMPIYNSEKFGLTLRLISPNTFPAARFYSVTEHSITGVAGNTPAEIYHYEQPAPFPNDILDRRKKLMFWGKKTFFPGETFRARAGYEVIRLLPSDHDVCLLQFVTPTLLSLRWSYDDQSLLPVGLIASNPVSSRVQFAAKTLMYFRSKSSVLPLTKLAAHPDHFIRWQAIAALVEVEFEIGVKVLHEALQDQHPYIRNAAKASLDQLDRITAEDAEKRANGTHT